MNELTNEYNRLMSMKKISSHEKDKFSKLCLVQLNEINKNIGSLISMFNSLINELIDLILREFPQMSDIKKYSKSIKKSIENRPLEPLSMFLMNIYKNDEYRINILAENDDFFVKSDFKDFDSEKLKLLFQWKSNWNDLSDPNKKYIKGVMSTLVNICDMYIENKDDGNKISSYLEL